MTCLLAPAATSTAAGPAFERVTYEARQRIPSDEADPQLSRLEALLLDPSIEPALVFTPEFE